MLKMVIFIAALIPLAWIGYQVWLLETASGHVLGADPGKAIVLFFGEWTVLFLILTLAMTPLRTLLKQSWPVRIRRMLGLFTFFYASLHLSGYAVFLLELNLDNIARELVERPYITIGFAAWLLLLPLALTSTNAMVRRLARNWKLLHRLVYVVAVLAVLHIFWIARSSYFDAFLYGFLLVSVLALRYLPARVALFPRRIKTLLQIPASFNRQG